MTETRATLSVPSPSPETSLSLGKAWSGTAWNNAGLCVNTDGRIWLDARGTADSSTLSALSNDVSGQLLLQSLSSNLFLIADDANRIAASGSVLIGGANGLRIFSAHGTSGFFSGFSEKVLTGDGLTMAADLVGSDKEFHWVNNDAIGADYFDRISPSETTANSNTAGAYIAHTQDVSDGWSYAIMAQSAFATLSEVGYFLTGVVGPGGTASTVALVTQLAVLAEWCAVRGVSAILSEPGPAGLDMYSLGSISWATPAFTTCYSLSGMALISGLGVGGLGLVSASVNGGINTSLKSPWRVGLDGKAAEAIGGTAVMLDAKKELNLMGSEVQVGAVGGEALTQVPTVSIEALSAMDLDVTSAGKVKQLAGGTAGYGAATVKMVANTQIVLKSPAYEIAISPTGISIGILKTTTIEVAGAGVKADCMGGMSLQVDASGVTVGSSATFLSVDATGSWVWQGPLTTMM
jgi:hypothetical protein